MRPVTNIQELSTQIAQLIVEKLAQERESGRVQQDHVIVNLEGFLGGDQTSRITFVRICASSRFNYQLVDSS